MRLHLFDPEPIATAPKDGTFVFLYSVSADSWDIASFRNGAWRARDLDVAVKSPTDWMRLPKPEEARV